MLALNLAKIRDAHERFEQVYAPEQVAADGDTLRIVAPVTLAFDIYKDKDQFRLVGGVQTTLELGAAAASSRSRWPVDAAFDLRYQPHAQNTGEGEREIEEDDLTTAFYENETSTSAS